jgi:predicted nucleic acid-binding protein
VKRVVLDTNLYIDWINSGLREPLLAGVGYTRILSTVVLMELRAGTTNRPSRAAVEKLERAYVAGQRLLPPTPAVFSAAGRALRDLRAKGFDVRSAAFVNDVLIALSARAAGASVLTRNRLDFQAIKSVSDFDLEFPDA